VSDCSLPIVLYSGSLKIIMIDKSLCRVAITYQVARFYDPIELEESLQHLRLGQRINEVARVRGAVAWLVRGCCRQGLDKGGHQYSLFYRRLPNAVLKKAAHLAWSSRSWVYYFEAIGWYR